MNTEAAEPTVIVVSQRDYEQIVADIENPPPPNAELEKAYALYKREIAQEGEE